MDRYAEALEGRVHIYSPIHFVAVRMMRRGERHQPSSGGALWSEGPVGPGRLTVRSGAAHPLLPPGAGEAVRSRVLLLLLIAGARRTCVRDAELDTVSNK